MNTVVLGSSVGDEGKGRVIDYIAPNYNTICRATGGSNAGHTIIVNGQKYILRLLPSAVLYSDKFLVLGQGMVIDFEVLYNEVKTLESQGISVLNRLLISKNAHVVMPYHKQIDEAREQVQKFGTTKKGIGPAYEDKARRTGIRTENTINYQEFLDTVDKSLNFWFPIMRDLGLKTSRAIDVCKDVEQFINYFTANIVDVDLNNYEGSILFEGAQGSMLDIDHGDFPFVTSSSCTIGGILTGAGVNHKKINKVIGVSKGYVTKVGSGPFPTEFTNGLSEKIREKGKEYGSVTKRPRRIGWLDLHLLKKAIDINGIDELALTKLDVLSGCGDIKACIGYESDYKTLKYKTFVGWDKSLDNCKNFYDLPFATQDYINFIEEFLQVKISLISVGAERNKIIENNK